MRANFDSFFIMATISVELPTVFLDVAINLCPMAEVLTVWWHHGLKQSFQPIVFVLFS
jgi:hypothetical protein